MPPKKAPAKKAAAAKKAAPTKATPKKPASAVKKSTKKTTVAPNLRVPRPRTAVTGIPPAQSELPYSPDGDLTGTLRALGVIPSEAKRAREIFRLYGAAAVKACGYDQSTLLNACLNLAFRESGETLDEDGFRRQDGKVEARLCRVDRNHMGPGSSEYWNKMGAMQKAMEPLMVKDQTERQNAFHVAGNHSAGYQDQETEEEEEARRDERELAVYFKKHPNEGHGLMKDRKRKRPVKKAAAAASAAKPKSATKTGLKKTTKTKKTPHKSIEVRGPLDPGYEVCKSGHEEAW